jgi:hypothetical protein
MEHTVRDGKTLNSIIIYWSWTAQGQGKWYLNVILYPDTRTYQVLRFLLKWLYHVLSEGILSLWFLCSLSVFL